MDKLTGVPRFTFGSLGLSDGLSFAALAIGLFGVSEILLNLEQSETIKAIRPKLRDLLPTRARICARRLPASRAARSIGFIFGIIPGVSHVVSTFVSYAVEKKLRARSGGVRQGRDRRCRRPGNGQQRHDRHGDDPAARARHPLDPGDRDPALGADHSRRAAGPAAHQGPSGGVLGADRQHVYRQCHAVDPEPAVGRACSSTCCAFPMPGWCRRSSSSRWSASTASTSKRSISG